MGKKQRKSRQQPPHFQLEADRGTPEFQAKVRLETIYLDRKTTATRVRDKRPIDKYHRLYKIDEETGVGENNRRGINDAQFRAADRITCNYEKAQPRMSRELVPMVFDKGINVGAYPLEIQIEALNLHERVMRNLNQESRRMVQEICCYGEGLNEYEAVRRWRKGYGIIRLREALDELVESFRSLREPRR